MATTRSRKRQVDYNIAVARNIKADGWLPKYTKAMQSLLDKQLRQVTGSIQRGATSAAWAKTYRKKWERDLRNGKRNMVLEMVVDGYVLALESFPGNVVRPKGKIAIPRRLLGKARAIDIAIAQEQLKETRLRDAVEDYIAESSAIEAGTSTKKYAAYQALAMEEGLSVGEIASEVLEKGLSVNKSRAMMIARTVTIWAYNEGAMEMYRDVGVGAVEWIATLDELTAEQDAAADGEQRKIGENFSTGVAHPPAHIACRCSVTAVLLPEQVLSAEEEIARQEQRAEEIEQRRRG